jgi:hypothetical protein
MGSQDIVPLRFVELGSLITARLRQSAEAGFQFRVEREDDMVKLGTSCFRRELLVARC